MSTGSSPSHYAQDAFVTDANFKVQINQKMKVPDKISFNTDMNSDNRVSWAADNFNMNVPERILVSEQHQFIGSKAPPREIVYDNSLITSDPYQNGLPRVATPPRTLTLDKYPFPEIDEYEEPEEEHIPVIKPKAKVQLNDTSFQVSNSFRDTSLAEGLTPGEEVLHLRRQMAKINRRVMALELENLNRLQKEKFVVGFGIAYFLLKVIIWMNRE
ncbi:unnamed protein product [Phaedon cochleariae]|uniref:Mff-like domain-containing protein n=1 Tax=Phaedon cochleariae TaxID=80249 RepID=A0A9P0DF20_PHACE|nr:unnamed protein product [Phaedon cochleariae]